MPGGLCQGNKARASCKAKLRKSGSKASTALDETSLKSSESGPDSLRNATDANGLLMTGRILSSGCNCSSERDAPSNWDTAAASVVSCSESLCGLCGSSEQCRLH